MFETLAKRLNQLFEQLNRRGRLSEEDLDAVLRDVKLALLEADVHYGVVKDFIHHLREDSIGLKISKSLNPAQQIIKIVNDELVKTLGEPAPLNLSGKKPHAIMLVGLQGSGKTTTAGKLASLLRQQGERVYLIAGDPYRPAAAEQLKVLGDAMGIPVYHKEGIPLSELINQAMEAATLGGYSTVILDTAGRSQIDEMKMEELDSITQSLHPVETLLIVDAMIGQEAVHVAQGFKKVVPLTGMILTKMDGDARGGAAISIRTVTGIPIKFIGTGEKPDALEVFQPDRLASRILGMGDVLSLIEKAESAFDKQQAETQADKIKTGEFNLEDLLQMLHSSKKMGPISQIMDMLPQGMGVRAEDVSPEMVNQSFQHTEAIINSMTVAERRAPQILNASRRRRIARGCGMEVQDVNRLMRQFREMQKMLSILQKSKGRNMGNIFRPY